MFNNKTINLNLHHFIHYTILLRSLDRCGGQVASRWFQHDHKKPTKMELYCTYSNWQLSETYIANVITGTTRPVQVPMSCTPTYSIFWNVQSALPLGKALWKQLLGHIFLALTAREQPTICCIITQWWRQEARTSGISLKCSEIPLWLGLVLNLFSQEICL